MKCVRSILYFFAAVDVVRSSFYHEIYVDQSIREILRSVVRHDVIIRIRERDTDDRMKRLLEMVTRIMITTWPLQIISGRIGPRFQSQNVASSRTLLIYIYATDGNTSQTELNVMAKEIRSICHPKHVPRLLLIHLTDMKKSMLDDAPRQLRYLWKQKFLDTIILEVSSHPEHLDPVFVCVHRFNGFSEEYSKLTAYDDDVDWYPNKLRDMQGSAFKVTFGAARPYGGLGPASDKLDGLAKTFADVLTIRMNTTVVSARFVGESDMLYNAEKLVHTRRYSTKYEHTVVVDEDRVCLLLPVLWAEKINPEKILIDLSRIVVTVLIGLLLTVIVWCVSTILTVNKRIHDPLNTIALLLCVPPLYQPGSSVEKILFVAVIVTATLYASMLEAELFQFTIKHLDHKYVTFKDLFETGLQIMVPATLYNGIITIDGLPSMFLDRFKPAELEKGHETLNVSKVYFISQIDGKLAEIMIVDHEGRRLFRLYDLCVMRFNRVHALDVRSPYKSEIDNALLLLMEYGHAKKHIGDFWQSAEHIENESEFVIHDHSLYFVAFVFVLAGLSISLIVFAGELIISLIRRCKLWIRTKSPRIIAGCSKCLIPYMP